jgi:hypothetical protein
MKRLGGTKCKVTLAASVSGEADHTEEALSNTGCDSHSAARREAEHHRQYRILHRSRGR